MTYQETLDYLFSQLPMFQRIGQAAYKANLDNTHALCALLGNPEKKLKTIHVAGTNGKGSTSHMLAAVLQAAGYKTGLYTSPHLIDFRERIRINGMPIEKEFVVDFVTKYKADCEAIQPSFFEWTVGLAFDYFVQHEVDIAVIETGMGGRLDSTNVISPEVSIITNIGFDHMQFLGDTLPKIAGEKAGIIKPNIPVVIGERHPETDFVFSKKAKALHAPILFAEDEVFVASIETDLKGIYQAKNLQTVRVALTLIQQTWPNITAEAIANGLSNVAATTGLMGRWQTISLEPTIICDTGHNEHGLAYIKKQLSEQKFDRLHLVLGSTNEKNAEILFNYFPDDAFFYLTQAAIPRAKPVEELAAEAEKRNLNYKQFNTVAAAIEAAKSNAGPSDFIFIGGSTFIVADALKYF